MSETVIKYTRIDRNQAKIANAATVLIAHLDQWLNAGPTGKIEITVEVNASQGGLTDIYIEKRDRTKI